MESIFSKVTGEIYTFRKLYPVDWFLPKSSSFRNFRKFPFYEICRLTSYRLQQYLKLLLTKFLKEILKILENIQEEVCNGGSF